MAYIVNDCFVNELTEIDERDIESVADYDDNYFMITNFDGLSYKVSKAEMNAQGFNGGLYHGN